MSDQPAEMPLNVEITLPSELEAGVFADFANLWHTPNTFVLDFLSVARPPTLKEGEDAATMPTRVVARVRIPPEQIFPIIDALRTQSQQWLTETGRSEPPESWVPRAQPPQD